MTRFDSEDMHNALDAARRHGTDVDTTFALVDIVKEAIVKGSVDDDTIVKVEEEASQSGFDVDGTLFVTEVAEALGYVW